MRLTGALLLVLAGLLAGLGAAGEMKKTVCRREELCLLLERVAYELERFRTPLPELFSALARHEEGAARALCRGVESRISELGRVSFEEIWRDGIAFLPPEERHILAGLGSVLGRYGAEQQLPALASCRRDMETALGKARARASELGRVYIGLCTGGGVLAAVLLI